MGIFNALKSLLAGQAEQDVCDNTFVISVDLDALEQSMAEIKRATELARAGSLQEAVTSYSRAIELNRNSADAWTGKAGVLILMRRFDEALKCCETAISINKDNGGAWFNKGLILANGFKNLQEGLKSFEQAERLGIKQAGEAAAQLRKKLTR